MASDPAAVLRALADDLRREGRPSLAWVLEHGDTLPVAWATCQDSLAIWDLARLVLSPGDLMRADRACEAHREVHDAVRSAVPTLTLADVLAACGSSAATSSRGTSP